MFEMSAKRLRRARRLYGRLVVLAICQAPTESVLWACVEKAKANGLYSSLTADVDVAFSLLRYAFKHIGMRNQCHARMGFWHFIETFDFKMHVHHAGRNKNRKRHPRLFLRSVA